MPQQPSPPYYPASITIPRQLVRWDDVNAQNGPLRRCAITLLLPTFATIIPNWLGVPDLVAAFNVECQNNFTLPIHTIPQSTVTRDLITITVGQAVQDNGVGIGAEGNNNTLIS